jgi:hypothetical protein
MPLIYTFQPNKSIGRELRTLLNMSSGLPLSMKDKNISLLDLETKLFDNGDKISKKIAPSNGK